MAFVAAAGPPANFVMAAVFGVIAFALQKHGTPTNNWLVQAVRICAVTNMLLGILNLIPVPPLDGSKVLAAVLPETWRKSYLRMGRHGYLLALMLIGLLVLVVVMIAVIRAIL